MKTLVYDCFAVTVPGLEAVCSAELEELGITALQVRGGVSFRGGLHELYLANLWLRSVSRILVRLGTVTARDFPTLYQRLLRLPWGRFIKPGTGCDIRAVSSRSRLTHTGRMIDVCRQVIDKALGSSSQLSADPHQLVLLRAHDNQIEVSIDSSGEHLHRRGYRQTRSAAPLRENLAAAALLACGYDGSLPLVDMMTGSGTFAIEAGFIAANRPPGVDRRFAFMTWPKYRPRLWQQLLDEAGRGDRGNNHASICGVDSNPKAVAAALANLERAKLGGVIKITKGMLQELQPSAKTGLLIGNPPYGARLGRYAGLPRFYRDIENLFTGPFSLWKCALVCPETVVAKMTGIRMSPVVGFSHGGIKVSLYLKEPDKSP